jgi:hypothetical protein
MVVTIANVEDLGQDKLFLFVLHAEYLRPTL